MASSKQKASILLLASLACSPGGNQGDVTPCSKTSAIGNFSPDVEASKQNLFRVGSVSAKIDKAYAGLIPPPLLEILEANAKDPKQSMAYFETNCTIMVLPPAKNESLLSFWAAEHCILPSLLWDSTDNVTISIGDDQYSVDSPIIKAFTTFSKDYKSARLSSSEVGRFRPTENLKIINQLQSLKSKAKDKEKALDDVSETILRESNEEHLLFGGHLCNNINKFEGRIDQIQRSCFLFDDLFAFKGSLVKEGSPTTNIGLDTDTFQEKIDQSAAKQWRDAVLDIPKAMLSYAVKNTALAQLGSCLGKDETPSCQKAALEILDDTQFKGYLERPQNTGYHLKDFIKLVETAPAEAKPTHPMVKSANPAPKGFRDRITSREIFSFLEDEYAKSIRELYLAWNFTTNNFEPIKKLVVNPAGATSSSSLHYVGFVQEGADKPKVYGAYNLFDNFRESRASLWVRNYGMVLVHNSTPEPGAKTILFGSGDSGSILLFDGILPVAALATVNDKDSTSGGGRAIAPPISKEELAQIEAEEFDLDEALTANILEASLDRETLKRNLIATVGNPEDIGEPSSEQPSIAERENPEPYTITDTATVLSPQSTDNPADFDPSQSDCI